LVTSTSAVCTDWSIWRCKIRRAIARSEIVEAVLDRHDDAGERALDVHVSRLRKKLGPHAASLATVWGIGYRLDVPAGETEGRDTAPRGPR
jgi:DNA-binding winged helix-turn-helix (wHTH) protein